MTESDPTDSQTTPPNSSITETPNHSPSETEQYIFPVMSYRLKQEPVVVTAIQYFGYEMNSKEVELFLGDCFVAHQAEGNKIVVDMPGLPGESKARLEVSPGYWFFKKPFQKGDDYVAELYLLDDENFSSLYTQVSDDFPYIGPECFSDKEETVIALRGENFYRACGAPVTKLSTCVKRVEHPGIEHEDFEGNRVLREEYQKATTPRDKLEILWPRNVFGDPVTKTELREVWGEYVMPLAEKPREDLTPNEHTLMAVLRHVYGVMPEDEE